MVIFLVINFVIYCKVLLYLYGENDFAKVSKNLLKVSKDTENNFIRSSKLLCKRCSNWLL